MPIEENLEGRSGEWTFDAEVTDGFDEMLERSIPEYGRMRSQVVELVGGFLPRSDSYDPRILDLGTSRGGVIESLWNRYGATCRYVGLEVSEPMIAAARERFSGFEDYISIENCDLRTQWPAGSFDAILSVLTLMFTPLEYRNRILRNVYRSLRPGGVFVLVEKVLGATAELDAALVDRYHDHKRRTGYSAVEIDRKRIALEGVLVPCTSAWNAELLTAAGFRASDVFWRSLNFEARFAIRE